MKEKLLLVDEVAGFLRVSRPRLYRWLRMGKLPGIKIAGTWRIPESALTALLAPASNAAVDVQSIALGDDAPMAVRGGGR